MSARTLFLSAAILSLLVVFLMDANHSTLGGGETYPCRLRERWC